MAQNINTPTEKVRQWIDERTNKNFEDSEENPKGRKGALFADLHEDYCDWCECVGCDPLNDVDFGWALTEVGVEKHRMQLGNGRRLLLNSNKYPHADEKWRKRKKRE